MTTLYIQDQPVRLRAFHDLSAVASLGQVFSVYDQLTSGLLAFGVQRGEHRLFIKYAGAPTLNYPSDPQRAVERLRNAVPNYAALRHPALVRLLDAQEDEHSCLCVFEWLPGIPLGPLPEHYAAFRRTSLTDRLRMYDAVADLNLRAESLDLVIAGLSDTHLMYMPESGQLIMTNIETIFALPSINVRGRLPGSPFYLPPEGYRKGAALDETSSVYALGALLTPSLATGPAPIAMPGRPQTGCTPWPPRPRIKTATTAIRPRQHTWPPGGRRCSAPGFSFL